MDDVSCMFVCSYRMFVCDQPTKSNIFVGVGSIPLSACVRCLIPEGLVIIGWKEPWNPSIHHAIN